MKLHELQAQGGPAFPTHRLECDFGTDDRELATKHPGMMLRDYFAAKAMQGFLSSGRINTDHVARHYAKDISESAYALADAMLKAREK